MSTTIEYILSLNDKITGKLAKIGIENSKQLEVWGKVQQKVTSADATLKKCGVSIGSLRERVSALRAEKEWIPSSNIRAIRTTGKEIDRLEGKIKKLSRSSKGIKGSLSEAFDSILGAAFVKNPFVIAGTAMAASFQKGFAREKVKVAFDVMLGDEAASSKMRESIRQFGASTPYLTANLQENAKMMLGFGIATDRVMPNLRMLGDIAMGDKVKMDSLTLAFSQATASGKLMGQDLLQMINAGFNPLQEISRTTGKSMAVLKDEMSKGKISSEMLRGAFMSATGAGGRFNGMTEKMGQTAGGKFSTIIDNASQLLLKLYNIIEPIVIPALDAFSYIIGVAGFMLDGLHKMILGVVDGMRWWINELLTGNPIILGVTILVGSLAIAMGLMVLKAKAVALWAGIVAVAKGVWAVAQMGLNAVLYACPITWIVALVIALIAVIAYVCYKVDGWGSLWKGVVGFMKYTFKAFVESVKLYFTTVVNGIMIGLNLIKLGWYKFKEACGIGDSSENKNAIAAINADVEKRQKAIVDGAKKVAENARKAKESLGGISMSWNSERSLSDVVGKLKGSLGIESPAIPGTAGGTTGGTEGGTTGGDAVTTIAGGGSKTSTINITLKSLVENIIFEGGYEGDRDNMISDLESSLIRVLQMAKSAQ